MNFTFSLGIVNICEPMVAIQYGLYCRISKKKKKEHTTNSNAQYLAGCMVHLDHKSSEKLHNFSDFFDSKQEEISQSIRFSSR